MSASWHSEFLVLSEERLMALRNAVDASFRSFTRAYGEDLENFFDPLRTLLLFAEQLFVQTAWPIVLIAVATVIWLVARSFKIVLGALFSLMLIGFFGMWDDTMKTLAMICVCTVVALSIGLPVGILVSRSDRLQALVNPTLDVMQTMPSFVYLIPVVMLLGIGRVTGLIAVVIYALPPVIRFTNLGIRLVAREVLEAADAFGASSWHKMFTVQLPLALPTIMAGVNQTIMLALAMVVIASMIGVQGLGQPVLKAISNQYFTLGMLNGCAIVLIAIIFDRTTQAYGKRLQKHLEVVHG